MFIIANKKKPKPLSKTGDVDIKLKDILLSGFIPEYMIFDPRL